MKEIAEWGFTPNWNGVRNSLRGDASPESLAGSPDVYSVWRGLNTPSAPAITASIHCTDGDFEICPHSSGTMWSSWEPGGHGNYEAVKAPRAGPAWYDLDRLSHGWAL